jgi:ParB-like chromosome segregation protein Spo0J
VITRNGKKGQFQVEKTEGGYRLLVPFDEVRYEGHKLHRMHDDHARLRDPFNPMSGRWSENVRRNTGKDTMDELRDSMREFGWVEEFPAIQDERGVVLVGHRRLTVAQELGIDPVVKRVKLGDGDEADAKRFRIAIVSNLAAKPFTPEERKDLAEYLYGEREWTQARIAEALNVSQKTVSKDLSNYTSGINRTGPGRPAKTARKAPPELDAEVQTYVDSGQAVPRIELAEKYDISPGSVEASRNRALGRVEGREATHSASTQEPSQSPSCTCPTCGHIHEAKGGP